VRVNMRSSERLCASSVARPWHTQTVGCFAGRQPDKAGCVAHAKNIISPSPTSVPSQVCEETSVPCRRMTCTVRPRQRLLGHTEWRPSRAYGPSAFAKGPVSGMRLWLDCAARSPAPRNHLDAGYRLKVRRPALVQSEGGDNWACAKGVKWRGSRRAGGGLCGPHRRGAVRRSGRRRRIVA
jgi:hypothetical protein